MSAREDVETRAGGVEGQRVGKTRAFGLDLVALRAFGFELPDEIVMTIRSGSRCPVRIAARMADLIQEARIVHAAGLAIERGIGGARDRHWRLDAGRSVDARQHHALKRLSACRRRSAELFNRLREAPQRECLAGAGRSQDPRQKRRLDLRGHAKMRQRLHDLASVQEVRPFGRIAEEDRFSPDGSGGRRRRDRNGRSGRLRRELARRAGRLACRLSQPPRAGGPSRSRLARTIHPPQRALGKLAERRLI